MLQPALRKNALREGQRDLVDETPKMRKMMKNYGGLFKRSCARYYNRR